MLEHPLCKERPLVRPLDSDLDRVAALIAKAKRIAIFGGAGCKDARDEVLKLSEVLNAPVGYTFRGKDILEAQNPNAVGMTGLLGWGSAHVAIADCDLLLMLGTDFPYHPYMPEDSTMVQIDEQPSHLGRRAKVHLGLVGDVAETLKALLPRLTQRTERDFLDKMLAARKKAEDDLQTYATRPGGGKGLRPEMVATAIGNLAADDAVFSLDTACVFCGGPIHPHASRPADTRLVRPRIDGQRHATGNWRGPRHRAPEHRFLWGWRLHHADGRDPHRGGT